MKRIMALRLECNRAITRFEQHQMLDDGLVKVLLMDCASFYALKQLDDLQASDEGLHVFQKLASRVHNFLKIIFQYRC